MAIEAIAGVSVVGLSFEHVMECITNAGRPMTMRLSLQDLTQTAEAWDGGESQVQVLIDTLRAEIRRQQAEVQTCESMRARAGMEERVSRSQRDATEFGLQAQVDALEAVLEELQSELRSSKHDLDQACLEEGVSQQVIGQRDRLQLECSKHNANAEASRLQVLGLEESVSRLQAQLSKMGDAADARTVMWSQLLEQRDVLQQDTERMRDDLASISARHALEKADLIQIQSRQAFEADVLEASLRGAEERNYSLKAQLDDVTKLSAGHQGSKQQIQHEVSRLGAALAVAQAQMRDMGKRALELSRVTAGELGRRDAVEIQLGEMLRQVQEQLRSISGVLSRTSQALTERLLPYMDV